MEMKVVFLVVKLCIIIIVSLVHESAGYTISPSPTFFSILSPTKARTPSPVYGEKPPRASSPSLSPMPTVIHAPEVSHPGNTAAPVPKSIAPSVPPSPPKVVPSIKPVPLPQVIQDPSMPPSPSKVVPSQQPAPLPHVAQGLVPSLPPNLSEVVPSQKPAPLPKVIQGFVPSMPPSPPKVVPSQKPAPLPQVIQGFVPSMPPSSPKVVPSNKPAPLPQVIQGFVPSMPPNPPLVIPSHKPAPPPQLIQGFIPSMPPNPPLVIPSHKPAPPPQVIQGFVPSMLPNPPLDIPSHKPAPPPQVIQGLIPSMSPSDTSHRRKQESKRPVKMPLSPAPTASPPTKFPQKPPAVHPAMPGIAPSMLSDPAISPISAPPPSSNRKTYRGALATPPLFNHFPPAAHPPTKGISAGSFPVVPPPHKATWLSNAPAPSKLSPKPTGKKWVHSPAPSPLNSFYRYHHARKNASHPAFAPSFLFPPPSSYHQGPIISPATSHSPAILPKKHRRRQRHPPAMNNAPSVSPVKPPFPPTVRQGSPVPSPASAASSGQTKRTFVPPTSSPPGSFPRKPKTSLPSPVQSLPPPPPNQDCTSLVCTEPLTNSPPGSPCGCVAPMQVGLRLSVALYTFFPLVSELAEEIATGVFMKLSQVRIMGANAAGQQLEKTTVLIDLVPLGEKFDNTTALLAYEKFWHKQVDLKPSFFGDYEVLYVRYPGLPSSPPFASSSITTIDGQYPGNGNNGRTIKPLGVDVKRKRNGGLGGSLIAIIILSSSIALALFIGAAWLLLLKCRNHNCQKPAPTRQLIVPSLSKPSGSMMFGSGPSSASMSFGSSLTTHTGTAKTFSAGEIEKATNNFAASRILGEGGFGLVYRGILDDGTEVAVKVLKRDDQQGGREFLAEVEMLSRLHHRNLVKLIGICIEDHARCLVYELIPNGSVESHLHGLDKETAPLDWGARMKIALGAARGLAYLHEDSSPHVIHRDFKCSNILLEHDFTPKVADFGLARTALDEGNQHITTRVMGTFGYVAPEYAMTGHLLVKSDVYSYGVVLLELLTGRKPVDMSQPQGQENLVSWARPFLTSKEGLEMLIDPALGSNVLFDNVAKVAAIASMCVQPEVSHRPFMGEVVQALKLVCNECDETKAAGSESGDQEDFSVVDVDTRTSTDSGQVPESSCAHYTIPDYNSSFDVDRDLSASDVFNTSETFGRQASGSFRRHSSSGPLTTGRSRQFWQRIRSMSGGSISEHGAAFRL